MGKAIVRVPFTGGSITAQGVIPASYTTEDPIVQFAIERSPEFKGGKIKVIRRVKLKEVIEIERNAPKPEEVSEEVEDDEATERNESDERNEGVSEEAVTIHKEFGCNDDAKDYLEELGLVRSKLRTRDDIVKAGKAKGIEIVFV